MRKSLKALSTAAILTVALVPAACRKAEVNVYDAPKIDISTPAATTAARATSGATGQVVWTKAPAWEELAPTPFRKGNYRFVDSEAGPIEITVTSFEGQVGGLLANVNRWLGQAGLPPVSQETLSRLVSTRSIQGKPCIVVDLNADAATDDATRIYAGIVEHGGFSWFFKMTGPKAGVARQIEAFDAMLAGLSFEAASAASANASQGGPQANERIDFSPPEGWTASQGSSVRIASFSIAKEGIPAADFSITAFPGDAGGLLANVNLWRSQVALGEWTASQVEARAERFVSGSGLEYVLFDLKPDSVEPGKSGVERILVAVLERGGQSWFFKLRGDVFLVETQREKFKELLQSVTFKK